MNNNRKTTFDHLDIVGNKYGMTTVNEFSHANKDKHPWKYYYSCSCECGTTNKIINRVNLISNHAQSCGCIRKRKGKNSNSWIGYGDLSRRTYTHIKRHADTRNLDFNISIEDAWNQFVKQNKKCALTGVELCIHAFKSNPTAKTASLDRIDSTKGYSVDNIQWIHKDINYIKMDLPQDRFIELCRMVASHNI